MMTTIMSTILFTEHLSDKTVKMILYIMNKIPYKSMPKFLFLSFGYKKTEA